ncbi:vacuolar protein-sorting-associated protein 33-like [Citrus sinensis]|uniref:Vacuolar protein-sorting-associated protein 33-like n=1 Tax=Citrus sinensis TaxID=2711 RepID=A0ACB8L4Y8_CITSI|nr:vacuolar protein-sorting-associated protein 33-like [Citrus sinensis]
MAQIPNLDNAPLNLKSIREQSQRDLVNILKNIRGKKCLVIDPKLSGSLSLIVPTSTLKEYGIELRLLSAEPVQTDCAKVVYFVGPQFISMRFISSHVHDDASKGLQREYFLYFVPRRSVACEKILEEEKVHNLMTIGEYPLYMVPLDEDVLSFELDLAPKEWQVDGDASSLWHIAKAIHKLEFTFGLIPNVRAKGKASVRVAEILNRMQTEEPVSLSDMNIPEINTLVLIDREVDMVTPMCSQLTYEGLVDEFLRINNGSVELDASIMGAQQQDGKKMKVPLNSSDKLFKEIRDLNFEVVVQVLRQKATSMKQDYTEVTTMRHINLAQHLSTFTSKPSFLGQLDMEHTIIEAQSYDIPNDISYVFSGYAPLSIRLVQNAIRSGCMGNQSSTPCDRNKHGGFSSSPSFDMSQGLSSSIDKVGDGRRSLVLVVFVGGVTFAEISALRFLSAQEGMAYDVIVGTTKIISGNSLAETFSENLG